MTPACVCVEVDPANLDVGRRNFALNGFDGRFIQAAVGPAHASTIRLVSESDGELRDTPTITIDGLMRDERLEQIDLLLCDIQGAELDMLAGAVEAIGTGALRRARDGSGRRRWSGRPLPRLR